MKIAVPVIQDQLSMHFGHCDQFTIFEIDEKNKQITGKSDHKPPAHEPGVLPKWLSELGVNVIIAGGMGQRAADLFIENSIKVFIGAQEKNPEELVSNYLDGCLVTGANTCSH